MRSSFKKDNKAECPADAVRCLTKWTHQLPVVDLVCEGDVGGGDDPHQLVAVAVGLAVPHQDLGLPGGACNLQSQADLHDQMQQIQQIINLLWKDILSVKYPSHS